MRPLLAPALLYTCLLPGLAAAGSAPDTTPSATPSDGYLGYSGTATVRHSAQFLYGERHVLRYRGGRIAERVVLYTCSDGAAFARKTVSYIDTLAPDFLLVDSANGLREGIRSDAGGRTVFYRATPAGPEKSGPLPAVTGLVADAGFDEFVHANWQRLMSDQALQMRFLVPSRLIDYGFQVQHLRSDTVHGTPAEVFRLRLSGFWGWFLSGIDVAYSASDHVLMHYDGLSDLRDASGDNFKTEISFPLSARRVSSAEAMQEARAAPLRACR